MIKPIIGVMGPAQATPDHTQKAYNLGQAIAQEGWVVLTGGRNVGVMDAACQGAKSAGGLTVGILPGDTPTDLSAAVDIPILTGLGHARNAVNVLSSHVVVACGIGLGTTSEIALALKTNRPVILLAVAPDIQAFFQTLTSQTVFYAENVGCVIERIHGLLFLQNQ